MCTKFGSLVGIGLLTISLSVQVFGQQNSEKVLVISPEQTGIYQTGGLSHATTGLADALMKSGFDVSVLMPGYTKMNSGPVLVLPQTYSVDLDWRQGVSHKRSVFGLTKDLKSVVPTLYLNHLNGQSEPNYFENRPEMNQGKQVYGPEATIGESFGAFAKAAADHAIQNGYESIILNDWTTALVAVYIEEARQKGLKVPKVIFAIHNMAYQGMFPRSLADYLGLPEKYFSTEGYEFYGRMNFLKAGIQFADMIYTVSRQYAQEITTSRFGAGLDGLIRAKAASGKVTGILNGIRNEEWDPMVKIEGLPFNFNVNDLSGKVRGKQELMREFQFSKGQLPLFVMTSRMAEQKGFEYMIDAIEKMLMRGDSNWVVIGDGDEKYISEMKKLAVKFPDSLRFDKFSAAMEKKLIRYGDFFVNGAWFEPSGLNQFFSLKNGTIPVVSASGGLVDSVKDMVNGISFEVIEGQNGAVYDRDATIESAFRAFLRSLELYKDKDLLARIQRQGMLEDNSWLSRVKNEFIKLFEYVRRDHSKMSQDVGVKPISELLRMSGGGVTSCQKVYID